MQLNFTKPICFFDLETTGINISKDRIVEISIHNVFLDVKEETYTKKVNLSIPIPAETTTIHGILDAKVANSPTFAALGRLLILVKIIGLGDQDVS